MVDPKRPPPLPHTAAALSAAAGLNELSTALERVNSADITNLQVLAQRLRALLTETGQLAIKRLLEAALAEMAAILDKTSRDPQASLASAQRLVNAALDPQTDVSEAQAAANASVTSSAKQVELSAEDAELLRDFVVEALEYLTNAETSLLALENEPENANEINTVFRAFHTIKGVASLLELPLIASFAHHAESLLSRIRDKKINFTPECASLALRASDTLKLMVQEAARGVKVAPAGFDQLLKELQNYSQLAAPKPSILETLGRVIEPASQDFAAQPQPVFVPAPIVALTAVEAPPSVGTSRLPAPEMPVPAPHISAAPAVSRAAAPNTSAANAAAAAAEDWVRVRTDRLDNLMDIVGELVIAQSMVSSDPAMAQGGLRELERKIAQSSKIVRELQTLSLSLRMIPLRASFQKMARVIRDTCQRTGKQAELVTEGDDTELDRKLVDAMTDPLVHMIRNAVDHGIEAPNARAQAGKPRSGRIRLRARNSSGNVVIELSDDGKGLSREKLIAKAQEKGLIENANGMSDSEIFNLIFAPGFSTAETITDVSGRGVGMDVVRKAIEQLNGRIQIESEVGKGTTFSIFVPLTLAITDGMLVRVGAQRYIIPTVNIIMSLRPTPDMLTTVAGRSELLLLRGEPIPLFRIHHVYGVAGAREEPTEALLVVVSDGHSRAALLVDELLSKQQVVTKSLGEGIGKVPGISGGAILGDGRVGLIIEPQALLHLARSEPGPILKPASTWLS